MDDVEGRREEYFWQLTVVKAVRNGSKSSLAILERLSGVLSIVVRSVCRCSWQSRWVEKVNRH